ncbi:MAG TPA: Na+/H+ antiporter NhaA [Burkholderiaceae bacterium]|nr:Na+/H+ antiporter NhaA [Burkholderiaceae bacterium]
MGLCSLTIPRSLLNRARVIVSSIRRFIASESAGGIVLALAALVALIVSNSPLGPGYRALLGWRLGDGSFALDLPLLLWVNDLWMAVFFVVVGLEIKRELLAGELASPRRALLPAAAALGGMIVPGLIYAAINHADRIALRGWAIPTATDIAFALGILMLLGSRVPASLKVFLTAVAIIDDLGAIVIIALVYTRELAPPMLAGAAVAALALLALNRCRVRRLAPYLLVGAVLWGFVLGSGVHATVAGVVLAMAIPLADGRGGSPPADACGGSPLHTLARALQPWVAFGVLPVFAFVNAGVELRGVTPAVLAQGVPLGIALGLIAGKVTGVCGATWLMVRFAGASLPAHASRRQFVGVGVLCGIGFTMSLFIGGLAFDGQDARYGVELRLGVLGGSLVSALLGCAILWRAAKGHALGAPKGYARNSSGSIPTAPK